MKIRTRFIISTVVLGLSLLLVSAEVFFTNQAVENTHQQEILATQIEREAYELGYLANDYLLHRESQQARRWESKFASFSDDLSNMDVNTPEQQALLANIKDNQQRLKGVFAEVKASIESAQQTQEAKFDAKFMQISWSRLEVQNQGMIFDASRLVWMLREQEDQLRRVTSLLSFALISVFGAFLLGNYGLIFRRTLKAIAELQAGTRIIGSGDLDFAIAVKNEDEIGELSHAFNQMTASLKEVTASKADLEKEIIERKRVEEQLESERGNLQMMFNTVNVGMLLMGEDGSTRRVNNVVSQWTGKKPSEMYGFQPGDVLGCIHVANDPGSCGRTPHCSTCSIRNIFETVLRSGQPVHNVEAETTLLLNGNQIQFWLELSADPLVIDGKQHAILALNDITGRKQADAELVRLASFPERNPNLVFEVGYSGDIVYLNPKSRELFPDLASSSFSHPLLAGLEKLIQKFKAGELEKHIIHELKAGDAYYHQTIVNIPENGRVRLYNLDITARKQAEEAVRQMNAELRAVNESLRSARLAALNLMEDALNAQEQVKLINARLRESEQRLNRAQEIAHLGSWELDLVNDRLTWSDEVYRIFGLQPQEFAATYEAFLEVIHPDDRAAVDAAYSESIREGRDSYEIEHRIVKRSNGEMRIVYEKCEHFRNEAGQIIRSMGMVHDITERKQAEEALRAARDELELRVQERTQELAAANRDLSNEIAERKEIEQQLRIQTAAMEAAANGIVITDRQGNIQWTNPALSQISGYDAHDLIGQSMYIFKSGRHDTAYYRQLWNTILSGQVWRGETTNRRKDGTLYIEEQTITPVRDENGQIPHFIAIKQDITQRKQAEEELERRNAELQIIGNAERNQRQLSEALVAAALILNKSLKLNEVLSLMLEQIREVIPYQLADIAFLEGETFYDASHQGDLAWPANLMGMNNRFTVEGFPLFNKIRQSGKPVLVLDTQQEPDWILVDGLAWTRSFLSAPLLVEANVIGFVNLFSNQPGFFTQDMSNRLVAFAAHAAVAIQNAWLFERVQASTERLQSLSRRLVEIQENERLYISRELHDEAGQVLTSLLVDLRLLEKNISEPNILQKIITEMESSLNGVIENLHRIAMALRPASLDHVGLVAALRQHVEAVGQKHGLHVSFRSTGVVERLPSNVETVLYRIVQEALTNIVRHAHATRADVVLTVRDGKLIVIIEDDGVGFDPNTVTTGDHLGLFGMRERTEMIDGKLVIESAPGKGTTIVMEVSYADTIISRR